MDKSVVLTAVGDISFGDFPFCLGYGVRSFQKKYDKNVLFKNVETYFQNSDFVFGNLETVISEAGIDKSDLKTIELRGHPSDVKSLSKLNMNVVSVANNHALQHGKKAFEDTVCTLQENNIECIGLVGDSEWNSKPVIVEKEGIKFGFLGYAFETDKYYKGKLTYCLGKPSEIQSDISKLKSEVDFVVVSFHWGVEFMTRPSVFSIRLARDCIEWGAGLVLGHHPHVLQGYEQYKHGLIFYSLGNFVFDMGWDTKFTQSVIVKIKIKKGGILDYEIIPVIIGENHQPRKANEVESLQIKQELLALSEQIPKELEGDVEFNSYKYYLEFEEKRKRNRLNSYRFFLKNIHRCERAMILPILKRSILRKFVNFF